MVLAVDPQLSSVDQRHALLTFERALQDGVDPRLEIHAEERKDRNKLRRLAVVPEER